MTNCDNLSTHDQLTRLPNRRFYNERVGLALKRAADQNSLAALIFLDLNNFKNINDSYGHGAGDKLLATVAQRISGVSTGNRSGGAPWRRTNSRWYSKTSSQLRR